MNKMSREEKYEYWSLVVEEFGKSDQSIRDQCRANNIPFSQYYDWRKKIKNGQSEPIASEAFIEIPPSPLTELSHFSKNEIILEYGKDYTLRLSEGFNPSVLSSVLQVLRTPCCQ